MIVPSGMGISPGGGILGGTRVYRPQAPTIGGIRGTSPERRPALAVLCWCPVRRRDLFRRIDVVSEAADLAGIVKRPQVQLFVTVARAGGQPDLNDDLGRDLAVTDHQIDHLKIENGPLSDSLEERQ